MKKVNLLLLTLVMLIFISAQSYSQKVKGTVGHAEASVVMSMDEIVDYDLLHPADSTPKLKKPRNPNWKLPEFPLDESKIIYKYENQWEPDPTKAPLGSSPLPDDDFQGLGDNNASIPPDVNGTVGPDHLMVTLNTQVRILTKTGTILSTVSLSNFFSGLPGSGGTFDPRIEYDPYGERWIVVCVTGTSASSSSILIAVSQTDDPTGTWNKFSIDADPTNSGWMDYPNLGFNKKWVVISGNMFSSSGNFQKNVFFTIKKSDLYNGIPGAQYTRIIYNPSSTIVPALTYDNNVEDIYLISAFSSGYIAKYKISGDIGSEVFEFEGYIATGVSWKTFMSQDFSPQQGTSQKINSGDHRMQNVVYRNGKLWAVHHVFVPVVNPNRSVIQWMELEAFDGAVNQFGRIDETGKHFTHPTIAVNALEEILIGYASFSTSQYASASYSFRTADDPLNTMQDRYQFKNGKSTYYKTYGGARNRWGDYSATDVDPSNDLNFWTLQEYAELPTNTWGVWWAMLIREAAPIAGFSADQTLLPIEGSVNFTDESSFLPETWSWTFEGGTPSTSNEQHPQNIVYNLPGIYDVELIVTNNAGSNTITKTDYIEVSNTILPNVQFMAADSVPCVGSTTELTDQSLYIPTSWEWTITPGSYDYVDGTSSTSQNPSVQFNQVGQYTVSLSATNINGSNELTKTDYIVAGGYTMPYIEEFEYGALPESGWTVDNPDNDITWEIISVDGNTPGFRSAYINLKDYTILGKHDGLISPPMNFMGYIGIDLNFQHAYAQRVAASADSLNVFVSSDCGNTWTQVFGIKEDGNGSFATHSTTSGLFIPQTEDDWCGSGFGAGCYTIDLSEYAWQYDVRIKFESVTGFGNNLYIDNLSFDLITGMPDNAASVNKIQIFPNPTNGEINVNISELEHAAELQVLSIEGKLVEKRTIQPASSNMNTKLDLSGQPKGVYFIRITNGEYNHVEKVILK